MVMKRRYLFLVIIFSVTCMLLVQTNFDSLFPSHEWRSKFYSLSNLDSWTTSNSRRTVLSRSSSSFDGSEVDPNGQTGRHGKEENGNIDPENDQRLKSMVKSRTGSEYQASSSPSLSKEKSTSEEGKDQFIIDISPLSWFKSNDVIKDSYEKYFRSHLINYPYFGNNPNENNGKKSTDTVSLFDKYNPLKVIPVVEPDKVSRILLVTYFRSGSSFLGDLLQQNFRTFYTFEPLHYLESGKGNRIRDDKLNDASKLISNILKCNFPLITPYIKWALRPENRFLFKWNTFLWSTCRFKPSSCFNPSFLKETCIRSPLQVMKFTRIHMRQIARYFDTIGGNNGVNGIKSANQINNRSSDIKLNWIHGQGSSEKPENSRTVWTVGQQVVSDVNTGTESIDQDVDGHGSVPRMAADPEVNAMDSFRNSVKVVFLVRDPRGIYNSRKNMSWCFNSPCSSIHSLCKEMKDDLVQFERLKKSQPDKFYLIRYEDLSLDPNGTTSELFNKLQIPFSSAVQRYIKSHTKLKVKKKSVRSKVTTIGHNIWSSLVMGSQQHGYSSDGDPYSTRRNSKDVVFEWRNKLKKEEISAIESSCSEVIDKLGYREILVSKN